MENVWCAVVFLGLMSLLLYYGSTYAGRRKNMVSWLGFVYSALAIGSFGYILYLLFYKMAYSFLIAVVAIIVISFLAGREFPSIAKWCGVVGNKVEKSSEKYKLAWGAISLVLVGCFGVKAFIGWNAQLTNKQSQISFGQGYLELVESRAPFGSWFNRDRVQFAADGLIFMEKSLFSESSTTIPYSKIEEISIKDGHVWNLLRFSIKGKWFNENRKIYFTSDSSLYDLKIILMRLKKYNIVIKENKSVARVILAHFDRPSAESFLSEPLP